MSLLSTPTAAEPIILDGRKYTPVENGSALGLPQKTGYLSIIDVEAIELLFVIQIFEVSDPERTDSVPEQITEMTHDPTQNRLVLATSEGKRFALDLQGLSVSKLAP
ncbi:hypothetical protein [Marivita sp. XM-24bin2]|jgi:hypothetical protein|uniref:hypothetical protein n=1 Tax=unclassified Marivita TaxID=2632480 RepID=UPI000D7A52E2|nr:hypothetical protein [Marivita sp. XM-24bin2]MCR9108262.1 hypothetical protein [Paracoccaceae bacterium]PWL37168.1 MAG: hypothetical protein DCO97_01225 [Marivita sp. XM-24bin2]